MKTSTKRISSILLSMVFMIGALMVLSSLIQPSYKEIARIRGEIQGREKLLAEYQEIEKMVQALKAKYSTLSADEKKIQSLLPSEQNASQLVNQISTLASLNDLKIELFSIQRQPVRPSAKGSFSAGIGTMLLHFRMSGPYEKFHYFVEYLETNLALMDLKELKIEYRGDVTKDDPNNRVYNMVVETYYQVD